MLNRRHLRIKILQALYSYMQVKDNNITKGEKDLFFSIDKIYELYLSLLLIFTEIKEIAEQKIEDGKKKKLPTSEELAPNKKFINNELLNLLSKNIALNKGAEKIKFSWFEERSMLKKLLKEIIEQEEYVAYMTSEIQNFDSDKEFIIKIFKKTIANFEPLHNYLEEKSIFWNDDLDLMSSMAIKTLKSFTESSDEFSPLLDLFKDPEDEVNFVKTLYRKTIVQSDDHMQLIKEKAQNWELERIALMDIILMKMALTEAKEFSQIPTKVTLNEYIEISKFYSTPKSNGFINGILDKIFTELKMSGEILKTGRGLLD
jgi:transcription antitermination protein NusB